jgi:hypothetical protein
MRSAICAVLAGLMIAGVAGAAPQKHWHEDDDHRQKHWKHHDRDDDDDDRDEDGRPASCYLGPRDVWIVSDYYAPRYRTLPPGLQKKLYRTGHLPPGWERKLELLPPVVEQRLVPIPGSYRRGIIDGYVVIYEPRTSIVIDVAALFGPR